MIVREYVPRWARFEVIRSVDDPEPLAIGLAENEGESPDGWPVTESVTDPLKPPRGVTVTVDEPVPPKRDTVRLVGEALIEKSGATEGVAVAVGVFVGVGVLVGVFVGVGVVVGVPGVGVLVAVEVGVLVGVEVGVLVGVEVEVLVGVDVGVLVGPIELTHPGNLKEAICVLQLNEPEDLRYSLVYQKVQSSTGSTVMAL